MTVPIHPLDPLTADEVRRAAGIVRGELPGGEGWRFASIDLAEPPKAVLNACQPGEPFARHAFVIVWDRADARTLEVTVDLAAGCPCGVLEKPGVQPNFTTDEYHECDEMLRRDPDVIAALARRGIHDMELVLIDAWAYGGELVPPAYRDRRVAWCDVWLRSAPGTNPYAHFVGGLRPIVDLNAMRLLELHDLHDHARPDVMGEFAPANVPGLALRGDLKPLEIRQPGGVSFALAGHQLRWQRWQMRIGLNHREGLVLHQVGYEDQGRLRPIAQRLSFAERVVPYRDPGFDHAPRTAFDVGE